MTPWVTPPPSGVKATERRAGAIATLCASPCGEKLYAATDAGCVVVWDIRKLNSTLNVIRAARAIEGGGGTYARLPEAPTEIGNR